MTVSLLLWFDKDQQQLKSQLQNWFQQETQKRLVINGDIQWNLFPKLQLSASNINIVDADGTFLIDFEKLAVEAKLFSFLKGNLTVDKVIIDTFSMNLTRTAQGELNVFNSKKSKHDIAKQSFEFPQIPFDNFELKNGLVLFNDQLLNKKISIENINLVFNANDNLTYQFSSEAFLKNNKTKNDIGIKGVLLINELSKSFEIKGLNIHSKKLPLKVTTNIAWEDSGHQKIFLKVDELNLIALLEVFDLDLSELNKNKLLQNFSGEMALEIQGNSFRSPLFKILIDETKIKGDFLTNDKMLELSLDIDQMTLEPYLNVMSFVKNQNEHKKPSSSKEPKDFIFTLHIDQLFVDKGDFQKVNTELQVKGNKLASLKGGFIVHGINPTSLYEQLHSLRVLDAAYPLSQANGLLNHLDGSISYALTDKQIQLKDIAIKLDKTDFKGEFLYSFDESKILTELFIGHLDLDQYMGLIADEDASSKDIKWMEQLKQMKGKGSVDIEYLKYQDKEFQGIHLDFNE